MPVHPLARPWTRWHRLFLVIALVTSIAFGGVAISADDPATPNNSVGGLGATPNTPVPPATTAPTATVAPTVTTVPTAVPATASATPTGTPSTASAPAPSTSPVPPAAPSGAKASEDNGNVGYDEGDGNPSNIVKVINKNDGKFRLKGKIQLNRIPGDTAQPVNDAEAYASCANCETFAIALQIDLISRTATTIAPQNTAIAVNYQCSHCYTSAKAVQYVIQVDDPTQVPDDVRGLINRMQQELNAAAHDKDATAAQTEARVDAVTAQFTQFAQNLYTQRGQENQDNTPGGGVPPDATP
ncbi:MAG: hypothetical protein M3Z19_11370 [Chloroflexota bacterium]|nr:hypothetical protein [Chloroflexota bacterium]